MKQWQDVKKDIAAYKKERWTDTVYALFHDFTMPKERVVELLRSGNENFLAPASWHLYVMEKYEVRQDYNNVVSIKLVIPSYCQAKCAFCFMKAYEKMEHDSDLFLMRFLDSLGDVVGALYGKQAISLDITGNEPTFNPNLLRKVLRALKQSRWLDKINRVVLTTNGYKLAEVVDDLVGVVNYVNISTHHYELGERRRIFGTWRIPDDKELNRTVMSLLVKGIRASTVAVIYEPIDRFGLFVDNYIRWADSIGFESIRFRGECATTDFAPTFNRYINHIIKSGKYHVVQEEDTNDSHWCRLVDDNGFFFFMLQGVPSTYECSRGIEYIINDDGRAYLDYNKEHPFRENDLPVEYIFDKKQSAQSV